MAHQKGNGEKSEGNGTVAVAIDKDKGSQYALKWAVDHLLGKGKCATLLHVKPIRSASSLPPIAMGNQGNLSPEDIAKAVKSQIDVQTKELFLPFRCFCTRKNIQVNEVVFEDPDIVKTICEYVKMNLIENLVVGAASRNGFSRRFKNTDIPGSISKGAPDFCNVYVISKGKILTLRPASIPIPVPSLSAHNSFSSMSNKNHADNYPIHNDMKRGGVSEAASFTPRTTITNGEVKSPFTRNRAANRSYGEFSIPDTDISFVSTSRASTNRMLPMFPENHDMGNSSSFFSNSSELDNRPSFGSPFAGSSDLHSNIASLTPHLQEHSSLSQASDEVEAEMRRLKQELKQTMDMYSTACKEALSAKQKAMELHRWKMEEQQRLEEAQLAEEAALAIAEKEKMKCKAAIEAAKAAQRIAELEAQKRINAEKKALKETEEMKKVLDTLAQNDLRYRRYSIEEIETATEFFSESRKIGEGGYGPVYKCYLDHTPVAVKVLRPDAAQGRSQFQQEVEVLSCIRHPNMVLLLGACPEYGCLVYEYMANGSLDDCLFRRRNSPVLSWQLRFRIAAEIGTGLLFLHQTKPEPLVHRDLKPANILLDRNYVSKISDVGLARLVPPSVADTVTQYRMTSTAGTFCYIDPEYQQTGMLGIKSDIYSLGVMLLQIITAKSPMGLTHHVERAIENGTFAEMLDPAVVDWPVEEALCFAELALKCAELRRKDRPDLRSVILPELNRLRGLAEETMPNIQMSSSPRSSSHHSNVFSSSSSSTTPSGFTSPLQLRNSRYESLWSRSGTSSYLHDKD